MSLNQLWELVFLHLIDLHHKWENNIKEVIQGFQKGNFYRILLFLKYLFAIFKMSLNQCFCIGEIYLWREFQRCRYYVKKVISRFVNYHCSFLTSFFTIPMALTVAIFGDTQGIQLRIKGSKAQLDSSCYDDKRAYYSGWYNNLLRWLLQLYHLQQSET